MKKIVIVNYTPISLFAERYHGAKSHLRGLLDGFYKNNYFIILFGGFSKPYIKYNNINNVIFLNILPHSKRRNQNLGIENVSNKTLRGILRNTLKYLITVSMNAVLSFICMLFNVVYYERANKNFAFRPLFTGKKIIEINDSFVPNNIGWFDIVACIETPNIFLNNDLRLFKNPWPSEFYDIYSEIKKDTIDLTSKLNLVIMDCSPYGVSFNKIFDFINVLIKNNFIVEIYLIGEKNSLLADFLGSTNYKVNYLPILKNNLYKELLIKMDIAFVTYSDSLDENQKRVSVPMKIMDLLAYKIIVFCDQRFNIFEKERYKGIVKYFEKSKLKMNFDILDQKNLANFFSDVNPQSYIKNMLEL